MRSFLYSLVALSVLVPSAYAGFEWVPPAENPTEIVRINPPATQPPQDVIETIYDNEAVVNEAIANPPPSITAPAMAAFIPQQASIAPIVPPAEGFGHVVNGFGDQLPLAIALSEILPSQYTYAFGNGVNAGVPVSWDGQGQTWHKVLDDILLPRGLTKHLRGNIVFIHTQPQATPMKPMIIVHEKPAVKPVEPAIIQPDAAPVSLMPMPR